MKKRNSRSSADAARRARSYLLFAICAFVLVAGFFFAGRQHFSSMDYGMKNSQLRKQIDQLESEKRRLLLAREVSMSPAEIKKSAKRIGIFGEQTGTPTLTLASAPAKERNAPSTNAPENPLITKTVASEPAPKPVVANYQKNQKVTAPEKKTGSAE